MILKSINKIPILALFVQVIFYSAHSSGQIFPFIFGVLFFISALAHLKKYEVLRLLIVLVPNQRLISFQINGTTLLNLAILYLFFTTIKEYKLHLLLTKKIYVILSLIVYGIILVPFNQSFSEFILIIKILITTIVLMVLFYETNKEELQKLIYYFVIGCVLTGAISLFEYSSNFQNAIRFSGGEFNEPNYIGTLYSLSIAFLIYLRHINYMSVKKFWLLFPMLTIFGIITLSRSFVLSFFIIVIISSLKYVKGLRFQILLSLIISGIILSIDYLKSNVIISFLVERIVNPKDGDLSNGRLDLWIGYLESLTSSLKNLFFGIGNNSMEKLKFDQVAHNFLIEDLLNFGIIGVILIYYFLTDVYKSFPKKNGQISILKILPLLIFLLNSSTLHSFLGLGGIAQLFLTFIPLKLK